VKKREALVYQIQGILHDRVIQIPIYELAFIWGVGPASRSRNQPDPKLRLLGPPRRPDQAPSRPGAAGRACPRPGSRRKDDAFARRSACRRACGLLRCSSFPAVVKSFSTSTLRSADERRIRLALLRERPRSCGIASWAVGV